MKLGLGLGISRIKKGEVKFTKPIEEEYFRLDVSRLGFDKLK